ncbi:MAG TPA: hypothetical protein VFH68_13290 [Polyangia bacterium]|nr:hypothetical protein [Polyangia bacterium]
MLLAVVLTAPSCRRKPAAAPPVIPPPPARPSEFVHPPIPAEPVVKPARAECSAEALLPIATRLREIQERAAHAAYLGARGVRRAGCGSPAMARIDQDLKGPLLDRVLACVAQDETYDPEWNLLDAARASLASCADCSRPAAIRKPDCARVLPLVAQAEEGVRKRPAGP